MTLGVAGHGQSVAQSIMRGVDPVMSFQRFFDEALGRIVLGGDGEWMAPYLREAAARGAAGASRRAGFGGAPPRLRTERVVHSAAVAELQGIMEVVSQQAVRAVAMGEIRRTKPRLVMTEIAGRIARVGVVRGRALVSFAVVSAYNNAALDALQDLGIKQVDVDPEFVRRARVADADEEIVEVLTAGDDAVCAECEDISQSGPYDIETARGMIPAHPNCRCAFVPADDARFAEVEKEG